MKICSSCKEPKSETEFTKKHTASDGLSSACKICTRKRTKKHYDNNKQYYIDKANRIKEDSREWFRGYKSTLSCTKCEENHPATLDFHHRNPDEKENLVSELVGRYNKTRILKEIEKCDVLCANCHRKLHWNEKNNVLSGGTGIEATNLDCENSTFS